eukprot:74627-Chlamydomonas_euryale.AAC.22
MTSDGSAAGSAPPPGHGIAAAAAPTAATAALGKGTMVSLGRGQPHCLPLACDCTQVGCPLQCCPERSVAPPRVVRSGGGGYGTVPNEQ